MKFGRMVLAAGLLVQFTLPSVAEGSAEEGERVFRKCKACHSMDEGKTMMGPSLHNIMGRKAGTVEGYKYSKAMEESGIVWNEETMAEYLKSPRTYVKGTKMAFIGLRKPEEIDDIIAYLKAHSGQ